MILSINKGNNMIFSNIIGNEKNKKLLAEIINKNQISNAYMFIGEDSIGKLLFVKEFAKAILCSGNTKHCNECKSCIEFESNNNPDFCIIEAESNNIKIEQIRELTKKVYEKPIVSQRKVYIINDSNCMTKEAQNSLLKTLEEPPEYVTIILVASNDNLFLPTIKSRCTKILFERLTNDNLKTILETKYNCFNISEIVYKIANGSVQKALNLKDKVEDYKSIDNIFSNIENMSRLDLITNKEKVFKQKEDANDILEYINLIFFEKIDNLKYANCIKIVEDTKERLKKNYNYDMTIDNFLITIWEEIHGKYNRCQI